MGKPNLRLNPAVKHRVDSRFTELATQLLLKCVPVVLPHKPGKKRRGRPGWPLWVIVVLGLLRVVLRVKWEAYNDRIRHSGRIQQLLGMEKLPAKSTVHRKMGELDSAFWRRLSWAVCTQVVLPQALDVMVDATGFSLVDKSVWFCIRLGKRIRRRNCWKVHLAVEQRLLLILNWRATAIRRNDSPLFRRLLAGFRQLGLVFADAAYSCRANYQLVDERAGALFTPFKKGTTQKAKNSPAWKAAWRLYHEAQWVWKRIYSQRSKVESICRALKASNGDRVRARTRKTRNQELALRIVAYNVRQVLYIQYARQHALPIWVRA